METTRVPLRLTDGVRVAIVREPNGADELALADAGTRSAIALLNRLLVDEGPASLKPGRAADMPASDRDQTLAALHGLCFGDRIAASLSCGACEAPFDFHFALSALAAHVAEQAEPADGLRPPTGADELAAAALPPSEAVLELARRSGAPADASLETWAERLARAAPVIGLDLDAACPECGRTNAMAFDVQRHVLGRLLADRPGLVREVHRLATAYGWSADEIFGLRRGLRRAFVAQIDADRAPRRAPARIGA